MNDKRDEHDGDEHDGDAHAAQTRRSRKVVEDMVDGLNRHVIDGQEKWWHANATWRGPAGAGLKSGVKEFQDAWQRPFLAAFPDKKASDCIRIADGKFVAAAGYQEATHRGEFLGIPATGKKVRLRYMDFWEIEDGKIKDNWVLLDFVDLLRQLGVDPLRGAGFDQGDWNPDTFDTGGAAWPPRPDEPSNAPNASGKPGNRGDKKMTD